MRVRVRVRVGVGATPHLREVVDEEEGVRQVGEAEGRVRGGELLVGDRHCQDRVGFGVGVGVVVGVGVGFGVGVGVGVGAGVGVR